MDILSSDEIYKQWRDEKLNNYQSLENCLVEINDAFNISKTETNKIRELTKTNNFALIKLAKQDDYYDEVVNINKSLGLTYNDKHFFLDKELIKITPKNERQGEFIPYTTRGLGWHTDGYYNPEKYRIRSFMLFCQNPGISGGVNQWMDIDMLYITLREQNPELTQLLSHPQAMTIPAHIENNKVVREESVGAIFFMDELSDSLYMRYTQRKTNIKFAEGISEAIDLLNTTLTQESPYIHTYRMQKGEGLINNDVIHTRSAFENDENNPRVMLRGRYFVRV
jgi:hypothetical protein